MPGLPWWYQNNVIFFVVLRLTKGRRKKTGPAVIHKFHLQDMTITSGEKITDSNRALQNDIN